MTSLLVTPGVAGVDEAGRGPLAGPVVAAAVILPEGFDPRGIQDSKQMSGIQREIHAHRIRKHSLVGVAVVGPEEIDALNILQASLAAMVRAIDQLGCVPERVLIDGSVLPRGLPCPGEAVIKGDGSHLSIAAASIIAKTTRDAIMVEMAREFPEYGFEKHMGYPTPQHLAALREHGPSPIHRRSYAPVRAVIELG